MDSMRELLRKNLGRSLETLPALDRLRAAWPVACGKTLADRGEIVAFADGVVTVEVLDMVWLDQMRQMSDVLHRELARVAGLKIAGIHFERKRYRI